MLRIHSLARTTTILVLPQLGLCFRGSFLDCPSVVILVSSQSSAARKGLLAVGVWAFVGSLAGVDATVSSQRGGIAERLNSIFY
jgi:hypothetical protein